MILCGIPPVSAGFFQQRFVQTSGVKGLDRPHKLGEKKGQEVDLVRIIPGPWLEEEVVFADLVSGRSWQVVLRGDVSLFLCLWRVEE